MQQSERGVETMREPSEPIGISLYTLSPESLLEVLDALVAGAKENDSSFEVARRIMLQQNRSNTYGAENESTGSQNDSCNDSLGESAEKARKIVDRMREICELVDLTMETKRARRLSGILNRIEVNGFLGTTDMAGLVNAFHLCQDYVKYVVRNSASSPSTVQEARLIKLLQDVISTRESLTKPYIAQRAGRQFAQYCEKRIDSDLASYLPKRLGSLSTRLRREARKDSALSGYLEKTGERFWNNNLFRNALVVLCSIREVATPHSQQNVCNLIGLCSIELHFYHIALQKYDGYLYRSNEVIPRSALPLDSISEEEADNLKATMHNNLGFLYSALANECSYACSNHIMLMNNLFAHSQIELEIALKLHRSSETIYNLGMVHFDLYRSNFHESSLCEDEIDDKRDQALKHLIASCELYLEYLNEQGIKADETIDASQNLLTAYAELLALFSIDCFLQDPSLCADAKKNADAMRRAVLRACRSLSKLAEDSPDKLSLDFLSNTRFVLDAYSLLITKQNAHHEQSDSLFWKLIGCFGGIAQIRNLLRLPDEGSYLEVLECLDYLQSYDAKWNKFHEIISAPSTDSEPTPLLYYTSPKRAIELLEEADSSTLETISDDLTSVQNESANPCRNVLTVMHASYMNDPFEGAVLMTLLANEQGLVSGLPAAQFRDEMLSRNHTFLKSFTSSYDSLNMWSLYGNGPSRDCDGVCVEISPATFARALSKHQQVDFEKENDVNAFRARLRSPIFDFHLYKVAYVSSTSTEDGITANRVLDQALHGLCSAMREIEAELDSVPQLKEEVVNLLQQQLIRIAYLFKYDSYISESESRLILCRGADDISLDSICLLSPSDSAMPAMLCIRPPFQVYVEGVTMGPKHDSPNSWAPEYQYLLHKMQNKARDEGVMIKAYVKRSEIPYQ